MIETVGISAGFVALAVVAFIASIRLGMLLGRRIDSSIEARAAAGAAESDMQATQSVASASDVGPGMSPEPTLGREEDRVE